METFIVRAWSPGDGEDATVQRLRGTVTHVATGHESPFIGAEALVAFVAAEHGPIWGAGAAGAQGGAGALGSAGPVGTAGPAGPKGY